MEKRVTVVGAGVSGRALALFASRLGAKVFVTESAPELAPGCARLFEESGIEWECGGHTPRCCECGAMVVGSGVRPDSPAVTMAREKNVPVIGELDFVAPSLSGKLIAVTGTNGKTTCTSLIAHILRGNGLNAVAAGNIGEPLAARAGARYDAIVAELSSFQLCWNTRLAPDVAVLTNLAPDHIDWHGGYEKYVADKCKIFLPKEGGWAVAHASDAWRVPDGRKICALGGERTPRVVIDGERVALIKDGAGQTLFRTRSLPLIGSHNVENAAMSAAAAALAFDGIDVEKTLPSYRPPRHRCEKVAIVGGVLYVDDSKGTNVAAAVTALRSIPGRKVVILGGQGKGETYGTLAAAVKERAFAAVVIGSEAPALCAALAAAGMTNFARAAGMEEAVARAAAFAEPGDTVLLSPACTSWDMYKNFNERGDHFAALVGKLRPDAAGGAVLQL